MRIALIGATGRTGRHALTSALGRDHDVTVLVRDPARLPGDLATTVRTVVGDATDPDALRDLLDGADAVVSALGPTEKQSDLHTRTARALVEIMSPSGPRRFVGVSGAGIDVPGDDKAGKDKVISWLIRTLGGAVVQDKPAEYAVWAGSDLDWTLVRPPRLVDGPASAGRLEHDAHRSTRSTTIRRADLGAFLVDVVEQDLYRRLAPFVATAH
ncbi:NAD(P)H-binding protein [Isoptericola sp. AK164]|uniref:NAD(P)-dependent oxidoreductase n=1 Tax=Isoptericola sp. AK164 TaxID=3024246 RepID=UPI0024185D90|nr:NAD(P)H-binding protein [Isoptericola sp. AK164]